MSDVVIRAEGLGKKYLIGHESQQERYTALRDVMARTAKGLVGSARDMMRGRQLVAGDEVEEFWALKDVNFEIKRGEVVGIIGRNGAGKSTLLKILSRITEPTAGRVEIKGRVASLLEVGTGFHPELTGRENIFLNGAILGMTRAEIKRKFDEIVAFAEVEKFLDTPVKRYSSGMYVRLAFAVAAHLEPEILVVDEVLAVGDAEFQKKCLGKMQDVAGHGRTVLFVSHNLPALAELCPNSLLLENGVLASSGLTAEMLRRYRSHSSAASGFASPFNGLEVSAGFKLEAGRSAQFHLNLMVKQEQLLSDLCLIIRNRHDIRIAIFDTRTQLSLPKLFRYGRHAFIVDCPDFCLVAGDYNIDVFIVGEERGAEIRDVFNFTLPSCRSSRTEYEVQHQGLVRLPFKVRQVIEA